MTAPHAACKMHDAAREHHLDGILEQAVLQRKHLGDERAVSSVVPGTRGMRPIESARHQLASARPVEHDCRFSAMARGLRQHVTGDGKRHQPAQECRAVEAADDGAVAGNEDDRQIKLLGNRAGEGEAASGDEGDLDAAIERRGNGASILRRDLPRAIEERAVDVDGKEADGRQMK